MKLIKLLSVSILLLCCTDINAQFSREKIIIGGETLRIKSTANSDLDGDGDIDIVAVYFNSDKVVWYENIGDGTFYAQQVISNEIDGPSSIVIEDLNNDGIKDVLICSTYDTNIIWFKNDGTGNFEQQDIISEDESYSTFIYSTDIDSDGDNDIIASSSWYDEIIWFENDGLGNFSERIVITSETDAANCVFAIDLDGDFDLDLLSSSRRDNKIAWYENLGEGIFSSQNIISLSAIRANSVFADDLDGDGLIDVFSTSEDDNKVAWYKNEGDGVFSEEQIITTETDEPIWVRTLDMDYDGDKDVITASINDDKLSWFENDGLSNFDTEHIISEDLNGITQFFIDDINNDSYEDIVTANFYEIRRALTWFERDGTGAIIEEHLITNFVHEVQDVYASDMNDDGFKDLISVGNSALYVQKNNGDGTFQAPINISTSSYGSSIALIDVDNDGMLDILVAYRLDEEIAWYKNFGDMVFGERTLISTRAYGTKFIGAHDLNSDGFVDIICAMQDDPIDPYDDYESRISWYENDGAGGFLEANIITTEINKGTSAYAKDLDGDGDLDVLSSSKNDRKIAWYENDGTGIFDTQQIISEDAIGAEMVIAADLDGDGDNDVLTASYADGKMAWYRNDGIGGFGIEIVLSSDVLNANSIFPIDQDDDGDIDIIAIWNTEIALFKNLGEGVFEDKIILMNESISNFGIVADLDNDSDIDVVYGTSDIDKLAWIENYYFSKQLKGNLYFDSNENGRRDTLEVGLEILRILSIPENTHAFTDPSGSYLLKIGEADFDTYEIYPADLDYWRITSEPISYFVLVDSLFSFEDSLDFGFFPDTLVDRIDNSLTGGFPRCNSIINYWIGFKNTGSTVPSGIIHLTLDEAISYESASILPDSIVDNNVYWHYDSLGYFSSDMINVQVQMPDFLAMGDTLISYINTTVDSLEDVVFDTSDSLYQILRCAYDPNDKIATPAGIDSLGYIPISHSELDYTIRFQNTGSDTAFKVIIKDQLDSNLNWTSFTPIASSHDMTVDVSHDGKITFTFNKILLPDSTTNLIASQGFVRYSIEIKDDITPGTKIYNSAQIFFDENPPILTNTKINTVYDCRTIMESLVLDRDGCENTTFSGEVSDTFPNINLQWEIEDVISLNDPTFNWHADTSGLLDLSISLTTDFCTLDTLFSILIHPEKTTILDNNIICEGDSILIFDLYENIAGVYKDTLTTIHGCDSIIMNTLEVQEHFAEINTSRICEGDSLLIFGNYQSTEGIYIDSLSTIIGCDSIISLELIVNPLPEISFEDLEDETVCIGSGSVSIIASPEDGVFSGSGMTDNEFDPTEAGIGLHQIFYTFEDENGCSTTDSIEITVDDCLGLNELTGNQLTIYPNPFSDFTTIQFSQELSGKTELIIRDIQGKKVFEELDITGNQFVFKNDGLEAGVYILSVMQDNKLIYKAKLIVE